MKKMTIIGAGMSGMLAAQYFRHRNPVILEKQTSLPNNHKALLRFRSDSVSKLTGIPFKKVHVTKMLNYKGKHYNESNIFFNNLYSQKVSGKVSGRSVTDLAPCSRYIAPENFIEQLSYGLNIEFGVDSEKFLADKMETGSDDIVISTMPVNTLADILGYSIETDLKTQKIWTVSFSLEEFIDCNVYQTVYYPNPGLSLYRMSITGNKVIAEFCDDPLNAWKTEKAVLFNVVHFLLIDFGIDVSGAIDYIDPDFYDQKYGKLVPCEDNSVKDFMRWATNTYNVYSLGRWGTHRQLLMDDVVDDLQIIGRMIQSNNYDR